MVIIDESDIGKSREEVLIDLIYEATGKRIPLEKIAFGKPQEVDKRKDLPTDPNTFIPVYIDPYYDTRFAQKNSGIMYRRRVISEDVRGDLSEIAPFFLPFRTVDLLDQINERMRYPLQADDIVDHLYETLQDVKKGVQLRAHPESLLWANGVKMQVNTSAIGGAPLIQKLALNGFNEWQAA